MSKTGFLKSLMPRLPILVLGSATDGRTLLCPSPKRRLQRRHRSVVEWGGSGQTTECSSSSTGYNSQETMPSGSRANQRGEGQKHTPLGIIAHSAYR